MVVKENCSWMHLEGFQVVWSQFWVLLGIGLTGVVDRSDWSELSWCNCYVLWRGWYAFVRGSWISSGGSLLWFSSFALVFCFCGLCSLLEVVFVSVVSSCCPCLRESRLVFFKWSFSLTSLWLSVAYWTFIIRFFLFLFSFVAKCVLSMHSSRGRLRACVVRGPVDGRFLVWWVISNVVWTDSRLSIAGVGCDLIGSSAGVEQVWKVNAGEASRCGADK
jgi:hypothetical protein